jgi:hypothetical protein
MFSPLLMVFCVGQLLENSKVAIRTVLSGYPYCVFISRRVSFINIGNSGKPATGSPRGAAIAQR